MKKNQVIIVTVVVMAVVVAGWWFLLYSPRKSELATAQEELGREKQTEQTLRAQLARRQQLKDIEPQLDLRMALLSTWLPDQANLPQFINDAHSISRESGMDFLSISPGPPQAGDAGQGVISLSMQIDGGFFQLLDYLVRMEKLPRSVVVDSISISPQADTESGTVKLSVAVQGRMFMSHVPEFYTLPPGVDVAPGAPAASETAPAAPATPDGDEPDQTQSAAPAPEGASAAPGHP